MELLDHNKKVKALEKKNTEQETDHARMIMKLDRLVDSQDNQLRNQKFETGELERKFQQEMELKETEVKELKELRETEMKELGELKETEVKKLKEDNKVLKSEVERFKVISTQRKPRTYSN